MTLYSVAQTVASKLSFKSSSLFSTFAPILEAVAITLVLFSKSLSLDDGMPSLKGRIGT